MKKFTKISRSPGTLYLQPEILPVRFFLIQQTVRKFKDQPTHPSVTYKPTFPRELLSKHLLKTNSFKTNSSKTASLSPSRQIFQESRKPLCMSRELDNVNARIRDETMSNKRPRAASPPNANLGSTPANGRPSVGGTPNQRASAQAEDSSTQERPAKRHANQATMDSTKMGVDNGSSSQGTHSPMPKLDELGPGRARLAAAPVRQGPPGNINGQPALNQPVPQPPPEAANGNVRQNLGAGWPEVPLELLPAGVRIITPPGGDIQRQNPGEPMMLLTHGQVRTIVAHVFYNAERRGLVLQLPPRQPPPPPPPPPPQLTAQQVANTRLVTTLFAEQREHDEQARIVFLQDCIVPPPNSATGVFDAISRRWGREQQAGFQGLAIFFDRTRPLIDMPLQIWRNNLGDQQAMFELIASWPGWTEDPA